MEEKTTALLFNYYEHTYQGFDSFKNLLAFSDNIIRDINELANNKFEASPFVDLIDLSGEQRERKIKKAIDSDDITFYPFVIAEKDQLVKSVSCPHGFVILADQEMFGKSFNSVFEIRVKNENGDWQDWQAISGRFIVARCYSNADRETFSLLPFTSGDARRFQVTYKIEFNPLGNVEAPFEERCEDWKRFEQRYYQYGDDGSRL